MTPQIMRRDGRRENAPRSNLTFGMIILWTLALAMVFVVVNHSRIDGVDAATRLQHDYEPMPAPVDDGGGELEPDNFCEAPAISGNRGMAEDWDAEIGYAIGPGSAKPASMIVSGPETVGPANITVGTASDTRSLGWEEGAIMPVALMKLPEPDPSPGPIRNTDAVE